MTTPFLSSCIFSFSAFCRFAQVTRVLPPAYICLYNHDEDGGGDDNDGGGDGGDDGDDGDGGDSAGGGGGGDGGDGGDGDGDDGDDGDDGGGDDRAG